MEDDHDVEADGPVLHVEHVTALVVGERRGVARLDLPESGDTGLDPVAQEESVGEVRHLVLECRTGADQAHLAAQHVPQLGQLVEAGGVHEPPEAGEARIVAHLEQRPGAFVLGHDFGQAGLGVDHHGAQLEHGEGLAVEPDSGLAEDGRAAVAPHEECKGTDDGGRQDQGDGTEAQVEPALDL